MDFVGQTVNSTCRAFREVLKMIHSLVFRRQHVVSNVNSTDSARKVRTQSTQPLNGLAGLILITMRNEPYF